MLGAFENSHESNATRKPRLLVRRNVEEIERRRALPEEQRMKEDLEHAKKLREEKPKGKQVFLQKYWHKGAFHQVCPPLTYHTYLTPHKTAIGPRYTQAA
jgi:hypothetical protein